MIRACNRSAAAAAALLCLGVQLSAWSATPQAKAEGFTVLHAFPYLNYSGEPGPPSQPNSPLVEQRDGSFLGSTASGGSRAEGTVFRLKRDGTVNVVFSAAPDLQGGGWPLGPPTPVNATTAIGAMREGTDCGSIYAVQKDRKTRELYSFSGFDRPGCIPSPLVPGDDGALYGVADNNTIDETETGAFFKVSRDGQVSTVYVIKDTDGSLPRWNVIKGRDGNFYSTTTGFGSYNYPGTVFRITPEGVYTTLAVFGGPVGYHANSGVIEASDGNFYGSSGSGSVYRMKPDGELSELVNVTRLYEGPMRDLIQASDGYLYGGTGASIYRISLTGELTLLHKLDPATEGDSPGGLMQASDGFLYGSAGGGPAGGGTLFRIWPGTRSP